MSDVKDYLVRAAASDGKIRAFAASTKVLVEEARKLHNTSPVMSAALGRLLTASAILGCQLKGEKDKLTIKIKGDGPAGTLYGVADSAGHVKGFGEHAQLLLHARPDGKLDVGGAVGKGELTIIKDLGLKEPYVGSCELVSGEIAEDLTYYYSVSEQIPSSFSLGVLMNKNNTVAQAGGFMLQLLPGVEEEEAARLEEKILSAPSVTTLLQQGMSPEEILGFLLEDFNPQFQGKTELSYHCGCSRDKMEGVLISLGRHELLDMMVSQPEIKVHCDFCNQDYTFTRPELKALFKKHFRNEG